MNLKLIYNEVADIETSQEAADLGLEIKTVCSWRIYNRLLPGSKGNELVSIIGDITGSPHFTSFETAGNCVAAENDTFISAPLTSEIPLPDIEIEDEDTNYYCIVHPTHYCDIAKDEHGGIMRWVKHENGCSAVQQTGFKWGLIQENPGKLNSYLKNEATARLKMVIWLVNNFPKARQWYIEKGYLLVAA